MCNFMTIVKLEALQPSSCIHNLKPNLCFTQNHFEIFNFRAFYQLYFNFTYYYGISYQISNQNPMTPDRYKEGKAQKICLANLGHNE